MVVGLFLVAVPTLLAWAIHVQKKNDRIRELKSDLRDVNGKHENLESHVRQLEGFYKELRENFTKSVEFRKLFISEKEVTAVLGELAVKRFESENEEIQVQRGEKKISAAQLVALKADVAARKEKFDDTRDLVRAVLGREHVKDDYICYLPEELQEKARR